MNEFVIFILPDGSEKKVRREDIGAFRKNNPGSKIKKEDALDIKLREQKERAQSRLENVSGVGSSVRVKSKIEDKISEIDTKILAKQRLANSINQIRSESSKTYENPNLFDQETVTIPRQYLGQGVYTPEMSTTRYKNLTDEEVEIGNTLKMKLREDLGKEPTEEELNTEWRKELYDNDSRKKISKATKEITSDIFSEEEREDLIKVSFPKVKTLTEDQDKKLKEINEIVEGIYALDSAIAGSKEFKGKSKFEKDILDPKVVYPMGEGQEFFVINNKKVPKALVEDYENNLKVIQEHQQIMAGQIKLLDESKKSYEKISDKLIDQQVQLDILSRDYNGLAKAANSSKNFTKSAGIGIAQYASVLFAPKATPYFAQLALEHRKNAAKEKSKFLPDIQFGEAFDSVDNFAEFVLQESAIQLPILASIALTGGIASAAGLGALGASASAATLIGVSSAGSQLGDMDYEEELANNDRYDFNDIVRGDLQNFLVSTAFGAFEGGLSALPTARIFNAAGKRFAEGSKGLVAKGVRRYLKPRSWSGIMEPTFTEFYTEPLTQLGQNIVTGKPLLEGVGHAAFSGGFFGLGVNSVITSGSLALTNFADYDKKIGIRKNVDKIGKLKLEFESKYGSGDGSTFLDSKENTPEKTIEYFENRIALDEQTNNLYEEVKEEIKNVDENVRSLSEESFNAYARATVEQEQIRIKVEKIIDNPDFQQTKQDRINALQERFNKLAELKDKFRNVKDFGNIYSMLEEEDPEEYKIITQQAEAAIRKEEGLDTVSELDSDKVEKKRFDIYLDRLVIKDIANTRSLSKILKADIEVFDNLEQTQEYINKRRNELEPGEDIEEIRNANGFIIKDLQGKKKNTIVLTRENIKENKRTRTGVHEISHQLFATLLVDVDDTMKKEIANNIQTWLSHTNEGVFLEMFSGYYEGQTVEGDGKNFLPEEVIVGFMERVAEGKIDLTSREYRGFPPLLGQIINKGLSKISKNAKINFQGEKDIIDFLSGIARSLENGVIDNKNVEAIKKKAKDREKLVKEIKKSKGEKKAELLKSIGITPEMRDRSERADEIYRNEGEDGVWTSIEEGIFDSIINKIVKKRIDVPGYDEVELTEQLKYGKGGLIDLFKTYDGSVPIYPYVARILPLRSTQLFQSILKPNFDKSLSDPDNQYLVEASMGGFVDENVVEEVEDIDNKLLDPKTLLDEKLSKQAIENVASRIDEVYENQKTFKDLPDLSEETTAERFGIPINKLNLNNKLTQSELKNVLSNLKEIAEDFIKILPDGAVTDKAVRKDLYGTSTGLPKRVLESFYVRGERMSAEFRDQRAGLPAFDLKENITVEDFYEAIGLPPDGTIPKKVNPRSPQGQTARGLVSLFGKLVTNTTARQELAKRVGTEQEILDIKSGKAKIMLSNGRNNTADIGNQEIRNAIMENQETEISFTKFKEIRAAAKKYKSIKPPEEAQNYLNTQGVYAKALILDLVQNNLNNDRRGGPISEMMFFDAINTFNKENFGVDPRGIAGFTSDKGDVIFYFSNKKEIVNFTEQYVDTFKVELKVSATSGKKDVTIASTDIGKAKVNLFDSSKPILRDDVVIDPVLFNILNQNKQYFYNIAKNYNTFSGESKTNSEGNFDSESLLKAMREAGKSYNTEDLKIVTGDFKRYIEDQYVKKGIEIMVSEFKPYALTQEIADATGLPRFNMDQKNGQKIYPEVIIRARVKPGGILPTSPDRKYFSIVLEASFNPQHALRLYKNHTSDQLFSSDLLQERLSNYYKAKRDGKELPKLTDEQIEKTFAPNSEIYFSKSGKKRGRPKSLSTTFNEIIDQNKGIRASRVYTKDDIGRIKEPRFYNFKFYIPSGGQDFMGLMQEFMGEGKLGDQHAQFFEEALNLPYKRGVFELEKGRNRITRQYKDLRNRYKDVVKKLRKKIPLKDLDKRAFDEEVYNYEHAIRIYLWNKNKSKLNIKLKDEIELRGKSKIPFLRLGAISVRQTWVNDLVKIVSNDPRLREYADGIQSILNEEKGYVEPTDTWFVENITADIDRYTNVNLRKKSLVQFAENSKEIFNKENLRKVQAVYGETVKDRILDAIHAMNTGVGRKRGKNKTVNAVEDFINRATATTMFLNTRSVITQLLSFINFINWSDNNILSAGKAFADLPQFTSDFKKLFNSDKLLDRRRGLRIEINEEELIKSISNPTNFVSKLYSYMAKIGFTPSQYADSTAIAAGGATFYRNRINTYLKQGKTKEEAEKQALEDFNAIAETTQQSSDQALLGEDQRGFFGKFILSFGNTGMQYNRIIEKSIRNIINKRGDGVRSFEEGAWKTHYSKIIYYGVVQNLLFNFLQNGLFFLLFDDEEREKEQKALERGVQGELFSKEKESKKDDKTFIDSKLFRTANNSMDFFLRGSGIRGAALATLKNTIFEIFKQDEKGFLGRPGQVLVRLFDISPTLGAKTRSFYKAMSKINKYERELGDRQKLTKDKFPYLRLDNPYFEFYARMGEISTDIPLNRIRQKALNLEAAANANNKEIRRLATFLGWSTWDVGIRNEDQDRIRLEMKKDKKIENYILREAEKRSSKSDIAKSLQD